MTALIVQFEPESPDHTWAQATDNGSIKNHEPHGNTLYVVDISVSPHYRKLGIGKWLMNTMYELTVDKRLERLLGAAAFLYIINTHTRSALFSTLKM